MREPIASLRPVRLYCYPRSPYSVKVLVAAYEKGLSFDGIRECVPPYDKAAMLRMRTAESLPIATVPLLTLEDGRQLTDSVTIIEYLDLRHPEANVIPADPEAAFHARALDRFSEYLISPINYICFAMRVPSPNVQKLEANLASLHATLQIYDRMLRDDPYLGGDEFNLADLGAAAGVESILRGREADGIDEHALDAYSHLHRWWHERVQPRPSWQRVIADIAAAPILPAAQPNPA